MPPTDELSVYARVRSEMDRLMARKSVPQDIKDFLFNQWSRLMTGIYMARGDQDADWRAGWETAGALVKSLQQQQSIAATEQYLRDLPTLLWRLHEGCVALNLAHPMQDELFTRLALLHAAVARDGLKLHLMGVAPHLGEIHDPGLEAEHDFYLSNILPEPESRKGGQPRVTVDSGNGVPALALGDRVCFVQHGEERVLILTGKSPMGGMYLFTNEAGLDAMTYTHNRLETKFRNGEAYMFNQMR